MRRFETQAPEYMRGDLRAFLCRSGGHRMQRGEFRRQPVESGELAIHGFHAAARACLILTGQRTGIDRLPASRNEYAGILGQQIVQEAAAAARKASDEDRLDDRLFEYLWVSPLRLAKLEQVGEKAQHVPARSKPPEQAQIGCSLVIVKQEFKRRFEGSVAEV